MTSGRTAARRVLTSGTGATNIFYSGTVVSNGGDAAIHVAQHAVLTDIFGTVRATVADAAPTVAKELFPDMTHVNSLWPASRCRRRRYEVLTRLLRRAFKLRILAAASLPRAFGNQLLNTSERVTMTALRSADLVVYAGGTSMIEIYDIEPKFLELDIAARLGVPSILMPASLGPFNHPANIGRVARLLDRAAVVMVRDERSLHHLEATLGPMAQVVECPDVVFGLIDDDASEHISGLSTAVPRRVIISVRDVSRFFPDSATQARFEGAIGQLVEAYVRLDKATVVFASTCQGVESYRYDDSAIATKIIDALPADVAHAVTVTRDRYSPAELMTLFRDADLVVATRMHAAILAVAAGTPVLPIAYEFKTEEVFGQLGLRDLVANASSATGDSLVAARNAPLTADARARLARGLLSMTARVDAMRSGLALQLGPR